MKRLIAIATFGITVSTGAVASDVGLSIQFSQPGVFGRIDIGQYPQPQLLAPAPVMIEAPPPAMMHPEPVYLWVPDEHRMHWREHCREYRACGRPVYFVSHDWYKRNVIARAGGPEARRDDQRRHEHGREDEDRGRHAGHDGEERGRGRD